MVLRYTALRLNIIYSNIALLSMEKAYFSQLFVASMSRCVAIRYNAFIGGGRKCLEIELLN